MVEGSKGAYLAMWVPALAFAHLVALFFLIKTVLIADPSLPHRITKAVWRTPRNAVRRLFGGKGKAKGGKAHAEGGSAHETEQPIIHTSKPPIGAVAVGMPGDSTQLASAADNGSSPVSTSRTTSSNGPETSQPQPDAIIIRRASSMIHHCTLEWRDLGCSYKTAGGKKTVLAGVWGCARPREMHALIGPSGAGKSTLMDILAQRKAVGVLTGSLLLNGAPAGPRALSRRAAYVPQEDTFVPTMTALETLAFKGALVLPPRLSRHTQMARAREVLDVVGLNHTANTMVGGVLPGGFTLRGLSGGERRRLAIAAGIIAAPSIIFLDEPTSGLDSFAALTVMRYLGSMAVDAGHVIIASIHQPRSAIWAMFDSVSLLSKGMLMYTGSREGLIPWFTSTGPLTAAPTAASNQQGGGLLAWLADLAVGNGQGGTGAGFGGASSGESSGDGENGAKGGRGVGAGAVAGQQQSPPVIKGAFSQEIARFLGLYSGGGTGSTSQTVPQPAKQYGGGGTGEPAVPEGMSDWWFWYSPEIHGVACDWVMDLVSVGFVKTEEPSLGRTLRSPAELHAVAAAFRAFYLTRGSTLLPGSTLSTHQQYCGGTAPMAASAPLPVAYIPPGAGGVQAPVSAAAAVPSGAAMVAVTVGIGEGGALSTRVTPAPAGLSSAAVAQGRTAVATAVHVPPALAAELHGLGVQRRPTYVPGEGGGGGEGREEDDELAERMEAVYGTRRTSTSVSGVLRRLTGAGPSHSTPHLPHSFTTGTAADLSPSGPDLGPLPRCAAPLLGGNQQVSSKISEGSESIATAGATATGGPQRKVTYSGGTTGGTAGAAGGTLLPGGTSGAWVKGGEEWEKVVASAEQAAAAAAAKGGGAGSERSRGVTGPTEGRVTWGGASEAASGGMDLVPVGGEGGGKGGGGLCGCMPVSRARRVAKGWAPLCLIRAWVHLRALTWREVAAITRNPADVAGRMLTFSWIAVFVGLIYYSIPYTADSARLRLNVHFANTAFFMLMPYISISLYTSDRLYYLADMGNHLYDPFVYYIAKITATMPFNVLATIVYTLIVYGMSGLRPGADHLFMAMLIGALLSLISIQVLHCAATLAPNQDMAFMYAIAWTAVNLLMSNFFITYDEMSFNWLSQLRWLSAQGYAFNGLARGELAGETFSCAQGLDRKLVNLLQELLPSTTILKSDFVTRQLTNPDPSCIANADAVLNYFNLQRSLGLTVGILFGYLGVMHILTYLALVAVARREAR